MTNRESKDELSKLASKEAEHAQKKKDLEKKNEALEAEAAAARTDLRLALKRIEDLQNAIQGELEDSSENTESDQESYSSDESVNTFLANHKPPVKTESSSALSDSQRSSASTRPGSSNRDHSYA